MTRRLRARWLVSAAAALVTGGAALALAAPTGALAVQRLSTAKNLTWDSRTVLLDHFDGSTAGTAVGSLSYVRSQAGLGQAGVFGPGQYVKYGVSGSSTNAGTVEMWIRPTSGLTATTGLLNFNWNNTTTLPANGWVLQMLISSSATVPPNVLQGITAVGDRSIPLNQWSHVALTWSPTSTKLYLNGVLTGSGAGSPPSIANPYWAYLNYWGTAQSGPFSGLIDELRVSDVDRSGSEILADATLTGPAPRLSYTAFDYPNATFTDVAGVNAQGVIAGYFGDATGQHGFTATPKKPKGTTNVTFDVPNATGLVVTSINDQGTVTGAFWNGDTEHGFLRAADGTFTWLDDPAIAPLDQQGTIPSAVNNSGVVVGYYFATDLTGSLCPDADGNWTVPCSSTVSHGFVWTATTGYTTYDEPAAGTTFGHPSLGTQLHGLNNMGDLVGSYTVMEGSDLGNGATYSFRISGASFTPTVNLTASPATVTAFIDPNDVHGWCGETVATGINDQGTIVGNAFNGCAPVWHVFVVTNGVYTVVDSYNPPGSAGTATTVTSINNNGIVGGSWHTWAPSSTGPVFGPDHGLIAQMR
jgi:hypothetical protein